MGQGAIETAINEMVGVDELAAVEAKLRCGGTAGCRVSLFARRGSFFHTMSLAEQQSISIFTHESHATQTYLCHVVQSIVSHDDEATRPEGALHCPDDPFHISGMKGRHGEYDHNHVEALVVERRRVGKIVDRQADTARVDARPGHCRVLKHGNRRRRYIAGDGSCRRVIPENGDQRRSTATPDLPDCDVGVTQLRKLDREVALFLEKSAERVLRVKIFPITFSMTACFSLFVARWRPALVSVLHTPFPCSLLHLFSSGRGIVVGQVQEATLRTIRTLLFPCVLFCPYSTLHNAFRLSTANRNDAWLLVAVCEVLLYRPYFELNSTCNVLGILVFVLLLR